ncbi:N-acyl homoserine lactonase family protein [Amantichitinum ursilacus]|uniref:N-acyl homoserine lactonase n=1 Tax=Amantichitinum ursilacus TaxID=857265 RepID=A0A0N0GNF4_9NEIS|nr:N-acyl homoserine lactonase family protein [Amantichitinum ursilacus]KPC52722.1 N-acyl homoserine lactonase [Amantichitinum ursilacus]
MSTPANTPLYEVYAIRVGANGKRTARENFLYDACCGDPNASMPLDYYFWVIRNAQHTVVVDTCFQPATAHKRDREMQRLPEASLRMLGIEPAEVRELIITHLHWDHAGNLGLFPRATVHLQEEELRFCTGPKMTHHTINKTYEADDVVTAIRHLFDGRLKLHRGVAEVVPGVTIHPVGGHTPGSQVVRVPTQRGWIVLASDSAHLWANIRLRSPFPILDDMAQTLEAFDTIDQLADGDDHVIPGHDPLVAQRFPHWAGDAQIICLHEQPSDIPGHTSAYRQASAR